MREALQDLRFASRGLRSTRAATAAAILVLALGTGLNTTILALSYGILVRPLPYPEASQLVVIPIGGRHDSDGGNGGIRLSSFQDWEARTKLVDPLAAYATTQYTLRGIGEPRVVQAALVTERFFDVLRTPPQRGRAIGPLDSAVVLGERLARRLQTTGDDVVGQVVTIAGRSFPVIGIMPDAVAFPSDHVDLWLPARDAPVIQFDGDDARRFRLVGRMAPGVSLVQARDDVRRVLAELATEQPDAFGYLTASADGLQERLVAPVRSVLLMFVIGAALALLAACANAGSFLLTRAVSREREIAVRLALGAARTDVVRSVLAEAFLVALAGAVLGASIAVGAAKLTARLLAGTLPGLEAVTIDTPVLLASLAIAGLVAIVCGAAPALHTVRADVASAFRQTGGSRTLRARRLTAALVVAQIAASVVLLIGTGLLTRTVSALLRVDIGIKPRNAVATTLLLTDGVGFDAAARRPFVVQLTQELGGFPGVLDAGMASSFPPESSMVDVEFRIVSEGREQYSGLINLVAVTPGYFGAMGIPLTSGRLLEARDADAGVPAAVVSQSVAKVLFGADDPIGRRLSGRMPGLRAEPAQVVGVVGDVRYTGLDVAPAGTIYIPWEDLPVGVMNLVVRTAGDPLVTAPTIRSMIHRIDPAQPVGQFRRVEDVIAGAVVDRHAQMILIGSFAAFALVLATLGLVAALTRAVAERRRELAIRTALGSSPGRTVTAVIADGARLLALGITAGLLTAALAAQGLASMLYGLGPRDPLTYAITVIIVACAGLSACYLPARRAALINPAELLRSE